AAYEGDPAAKSYEEIIAAYPGPLAIRGRCAPSVCALTIQNRKLTESFFSRHNTLLLSAIFIEKKRSQSIRFPFITMMEAG
ncbi:MAG: hypothetical protein EGP94_08265, partial [Lachnospiraceae bacterium]|nr:hypothetical protein [Lachnospiraceae bacterium]